MDLNYNQYLLLPLDGSLRTQQDLVSLARARILYMHCIFVFALLTSGCSISHAGDLSTGSLIYEQFWIKVEIMNSLIPPSFKHLLHILKHICSYSACIMQHQVGVTFMNRIQKDSPWPDYDLQNYILFSKNIFRLWLLTCHCAAEHFETLHCWKRRSVKLKFKHWKNMKRWSASDE